MEKWHSLIRDIIRRPELYVGRPSLECIACYLSGYLDCAYKNGVDLEHDYNDFINFIWEKYDNYTFQWYTLINLYNPSEARAFEAFRKYAEEFLEMQDGVVQDVNCPEKPDG